MTPTGDEHVLRITRYNRGRSVIAGPSGSYYGTRGRCSCGEWESRENTAPSKGGRRTIEAAHAAHVLDMKGSPQCPTD